MLIIHKVASTVDLDIYILLYPRSPVGHCSSADRYFQSLHNHGCDSIPGLDRHNDSHVSTHRDHLEDGSDSDSIESIYKKLSTPKVSIHFKCCLQNLYCILLS